MMSQVIRRKPSSGLLKKLNSANKNSGTAFFSASSAQVQSAKRQHAGHDQDHQQQQQQQHARAAAQQDPLPHWFRRMATTNEFNLPRLPLPPLKDTVERYLTSLEPLILDQAQLVKHRELCDAFKQNEGRQLQELLLKRELHQSLSTNSYPYSYIEQDWDDMYLGGRYESPINVNPAYGLIEEQDGNLKNSDHTVRTAAFIRSLVKWWHKVQTSQLEQDKGQCMSAFARQLGTSRIPQVDRDTLVSFPRSKHIVVLKNDVFYALPLLSGDNKRLISQQDLQQQLQSIWNANAPQDQDQTSPKNLCMLTAAPRDEWANTRSQLIQLDPRNAHNMQLIDSALFKLVLDERHSSKRRERSQWSLHGNAQNRWFDKLTVMAYADGHLGVNFEHSFSDGTIWNRWLHEVWHDMRESNSGFAPLEEMQELTANDKQQMNLEPLRWRVDHALLQTIESNYANFETFVDNTKSNFLGYDQFGKNHCKQWKLSPDGVVQMAFQLAFHQLHEFVPATYESCSTRQFLHGRTETIRSATPQAAAFVKSVADQQPMEQQAQHFVDAVRRHVEVAKLAQKGLGVDRHLTALNSLAKQHGIESEFLASPERAASTNFQISSSNVTMPFLDYFIFGAVVPNGYGLGYLVHNDHVHVSLTNFNSSKLTDSDQFKMALSQSLDYVKKLADLATQNGL